MSRAAGPASVALVEPDGYELTRQTHGEAAADRDRALADQLAAHGPSALYRIADGRFALILEGPPDQVHARCTAIAKGSEGDTRSVGLAAIGAEESSASVELRATRALQRAKRRGAGSIEQAAASAADDAGDAATRALLDLLADGEVAVFYQPIVGLGQRRVLGFEAFARPQTTHGLAGPSEAFTLAEQLGLGAELDALCRRSILGDAPGLHMPPTSRLHLNVSASSLGHRSLSIAQLSAQLRAAELTPQRVVLEFSEDRGLDPDRDHAQLAALADAGFVLALDHLGRHGHGGLASMVSGRFPVLKLDAEVVQALGVRPTADGLLDAVAGFAARTGASVLLQGIESAEQLYTAQAGRSGTVTATLEGAQGFHLGAPEPQPRRDAGRHASS